MGGAAAAGEGAAVAVGSQAPDRAGTLTKPFRIMVANGCFVATALRERGRLVQKHKHY